MILAADFLCGTGEMAPRIRSFDWAATPLGPIERWPQNLRSATAVMIASPAPIVLLWGARGVMIYNDGYAGLAGARHPGMLGRDIADGWPEAAAFSAYALGVGLAGGTVSYRDQELTLDRGAGPEAAWMDLHYSPVADDEGASGGVICIVGETTDRIRAERRADAQREQLAQLFAQAPTFMALLRGPDYRFELANPGYVALAGNRPLLGRTFAEALPDAVEQGFLSLLDQVYATGEPFVAEGAVYWEQAVADRPANERIVDFVYQPIKDADGRVVAIFCEGADVTTRVRADRALRASEARLRFLDALGKATAGKLDADGVLAVTTRMVGEYLGLSNCAYADMDADEDGFTIRGDWAAEGSPSIVGHYSLAAFGARAVRNLHAGEPLIVNDNLAELAPEEAATFQTIGIAATICMPLVKDGRLTALMAFHDKVPHPWSADELALIREVTDRSWAHVERVGTEAELRVAAAALREWNETLETRVAERTAALEQSEKTIRTVFETSYLNQGLLTTDGRILYMNATALASIAGRFEDVVDKPFWDTPWFAGTPGMPEQVRAGVARVAAGESIRIAMPLHMPTGDRIYEFSMRPALDEAGKVIALVPEAVEITARVQTEEALRQAQKMEAVGQLTGGIAHDFNNLLAAISGNLELLERRIADGRLTGLDRYIDSAQLGARRAAALTQRLLAFSRRQTLDPRPTDVNRLVGGMADLIRRSVGPDVTLEIVAAGGLWTARIDAPQLENSLLNLCINARDAMAPAGGRITIETANAWLDDRAAAERDLAPGRYLSVCVTDTGTGMTPEVVARAFDPFYTTKPLGEGTGLGLSMVYGFARQSGGQVRIQTELGQGTTLCLYLPRFDGDAEIAPAPPAATPGQGAGETVLVIDDEPAIRALVAEVLEDCGYRALEAEDGPAGLRILQSEARIDLLITDVGLPGGMNGRQVADAARVSRPGLKVLFITGFAENAAIGNGQLSPGMSLITKPFAMAALARKIRDLVD